MSPQDVMPALGYASRAVLDTPAERLAPGRTALVVVDMQNDFCAPGGYIATAIGKDVTGLAGIVAPMRALIASARSAGVPVVWLTARYEDDLVPPSMIAGKRRMGVEAICCRAGSWGGDFFEVAPEPGEAVFSKSTYSGFSNPDLAPWLREHGVEALVFCGVQTNVCVESSLRAAHSLGFDVAIAADATGSHTPPLHDATLANVRFLLGDVVASDDLTSIWTPRRPAAA